MQLGSSGRGQNARRSQLARDRQQFCQTLELSYEHSNLGFIVKDERHLTECSIPYQDIKKTWCSQRWAKDFRIGYSKYTEVLQKFYN